VAIENSEKSAFRPVFTLFAWWFHYVQNNADSVFVVVPDNSLVCVRCVSNNGAVFSYWALCGFKLRKFNWVRILLWLVPKEQSIYIDNLSSLRSLSSRLVCRVWAPSCWADVRRASIWNGFLV